MGFSRQMVSKSAANHQLFSNWLSRLSIIYICCFSIFSPLTFALPTISLQIALSPEDRQWQWEGRKWEAGKWPLCPREPWSPTPGWACILGQKSNYGPLPKSGSLPAFWKQSTIGTQPLSFAYVLSVVLLHSAAELSSCNRNHMALKASNTYLWPFTEEACWPLC